MTHKTNRHSLLVVSLSVLLPGSLTTTPLRIFQNHCLASFSQFSTVVHGLQREDQLALCIPTSFPLNPPHSSRQSSCSLNNNSLYSSRSSWYFPLPKPLPLRPFCLVPASKPPAPPSPYDHCSPLSSIPPSCTSSIHSLPHSLAAYPNQQERLIQDWLCGGRGSP